MSDTPDVPRGCEQEDCPSLEAGPSASPQDTPTVEFKGRAGKGNPLRIDAASPLTPGVPPELADHPRYRVVGMLGKGGMGMVYKAEHRVMKRTVALKVIGAHLVAESAALARFRREVEAAAKLSHPNIVTAFDAEQAGNCHFLVMELVDGISFDVVLKMKGPLPLVFACDYMRQAALGLQHAHEHGMVHRDIKLQNLMLTRKGQVKILDFGLARFASENGPAAPLTECGMLTGTPDFMSPEQAEDAHSADIRADIYSLGCTFYTLLTGKLPFPGGSYVEKIVGHLKREPEPMTAFRDDLPPELVRIVERMMAKDPDQRFQTPNEVAKAVLAIRNTGAPRSRPAPAADKDEGAVSSGATIEESVPAGADAADPTLGILPVAPPPRTEGIRTSEEISSPPLVRPRSVRRKKRPPSRRNWRPFAIGAAIGAIGLFSLGSLFFAVLSRGGSGDKKAGAVLLPPPKEIRGEEQGQVRVMSGDANVQVTIRRGVKDFGTISPNGNPEMILPAGEYEVEIVGGAPELIGSKSRLSLARGDRKIVDVRREGIHVHDFTARFPPPPLGPPGAPPPPPPPFGGPPPRP